VGDGGIGILCFVDVVALLSIVRGPWKAGVEVEESLRGLRIVAVDGVDGLLASRVWSKGCERRVGLGLGSAWMMGLGRLYSFRFFVAGRLEVGMSRAWMGDVGVDGGVDDEEEEGV